MGPDYRRDGFTSSKVMIRYMSGNCQRHAPLRSEMHYNGTSGYTREWPITTGADWCGDYKETNNDAH